MKPLTTSSVLLLQTGILLGALFIYYSSASLVSAATATGWYAPAFEYRSETIACSPTETAIEIQLVNYNDHLPYAGVIGKWEVRVRDGSGAIKTGQKLTGVNISSPVCLDPASDGIQVIVSKGTVGNYLGLNSPTVYFSTSTTDLAGNLFRGYVHLAPDTITDGDIALLSPNNQAFSGNPEFYVATNYLPTPYTISNVDQIKLYLLNDTTNDRQSFSIPTAGGAATRVISGLPTLADGYYSWLIHQNFDGSSYTEKPSTIYNWTFASLPTTGATGRFNFTVDTAVPALSSIKSVDVTAVPSPSDIDVRIVAETADVLSGMATTTLYVLSETDSILAVVPVSHAVFTDSTVFPTGLQTTRIDLTLLQGVSYKFYVTATDAAGNERLSTITTYTAPEASSLTTATLGDLSATDTTTYTANLNANIQSHGGSLVTERGFCWDYTPLNLPGVTSGSQCQIETDANGYNNGTFSIPFNDLPADTTIYYHAFARNATGYGFSGIESLLTMPSAFATTTDPNPPTVGNISATNVKADSAYLSGKVVGIGGSQVSGRAICWSLSAPTLPLTPTTCPMDTFICPDGTEVTRHGPTCEYITCPAIAAIDPLIDPFGDPFALGPTPIDPIDDDNSVAPITCSSDEMICPDGTTVSRSGPDCEFICPMSAPGPTCHTWPGALPTSATLPFAFGNIFKQLPYSTTIYYKVFATNSYGEHSMSGQFTTDSPWFDFSTVDLRAKETYNDASEKYSLGVQFKMQDASNHESALRRTIAYEVRLETVDGVLLDSIIGTSEVEAETDLVRINPINHNFTNLDPGVVVLKVTSNIEPTLYPESTSPVNRVTNNTQMLILNLKDPDEITDIISGDGIGTGPTLPDPDIEFSEVSAVVRSGNESTISWDVKETYPMECVILGPRTFANNGVHIFDPSVSGPTGSMSTGPLTAAQLFELTCTEPITGSVFKTVTRFNVIGTVNEI